ncbi:MAG: YceI family protein [Bacteroidia bacterium]|nr:YceI family protein [Bacteroidia bacterium]
MKKLILTIATISTFALANLSAQTLYKATNAEVSFFSKTPIENIDGKTATATTLINLENKDIAFMIQNNSFQFPNKLMQEHFNEKYMESEKYPMSSFRGNVQENIDLKVAGVYQVTVKGKLTIHGVAQERIIAGTITVKEGVIQIESNFKVKNVDHKIEIPKLVATKIAEELDVKVLATLYPKK